MPFSITFDQSKQIEYWKDLINFLTQHLLEGEVGYGSRKYKYPLLIKDLTMKDSRSSPQLKLKDLFASSLHFLITDWSRGTESEFSAEIDKSLLHHNAQEMKMWPSTEVTPKALNMTDGAGINPLDFLAEACRKNPEQYKLNGVFVTSCK